MKLPLPYTGLRVNCCEIMLFLAAGPAADASFADFSDFQSAPSNNPSL